MVGENFRMKNLCAPSLSTQILEYTHHIWQMSLKSLTVLGAVPGKVPILGAVPGKVPVPVDGMCYTISKNAWEEVI